MLSAVINWLLTVSNNWLVSYGQQYSNGLINYGHVINPSFYNNVFINIILESSSGRKYKLDIITDGNLVWP